MSYNSPDIDTKKLFTSNEAVGSDSGGYDFGLVGSTKHFVKKITIDVCDNCIGRVTVEKYDETCIIIGASEVPDNRKTWFFDPDELIVKILLYSSVKKDRLAGIKIATSKQDSLEAFIPGMKLSEAKDIKVGSGQCVGVFGNAGLYVDSLGFAMLQKRMKV